jgi:hypothetical protein
MFSLVLVKDVIFFFSCQMMAVTISYVVEGCRNFLSR